MEVHRTIYVRVGCCDAPPTKRQCSCRVDLLTVGQYRINKYLTGFKHKQQATTSVKVQMLDAFYRGPSISDRPSPV